MNDTHLIELNLVIYQITETWEQTNFLKYQIRNLSNEVLVDFILVSRIESDDIKRKGLSDTQRICNALNKARNKKLIDRESFLIFQKEYVRIGRTFKILHPKPTKLKFEKEKEIPKAKKSCLKVSNRQEKILKILKTSSKSQVQEIKELFPNVSKRTLRRDLDRLLKKGLICRQGQWNEIFYSLV